MELAAMRGIEVHIEDIPEQRWHLAPGLKHVIGHQAAAVILAADDTVAPQHAELDGTGPSWIVRDLGTITGTWINGVRCWSYLEVRQGDRIRVGRTNLLVAPWLAAVGS